MVWILARLKLRLVANGFRLGWQQKMGLVLGVVYAVPLALGGFVLLALTRSNSELARPATIVVFLLFLGWLVGPLLGFGSDETLDPARLALPPLARRQLAAGLLAASSVGIGAAATAIVVSGAVVGLAPPGPGAVVVLAAVVAEFALSPPGLAARAVLAARAGDLGEALAWLAGAVLVVGLLARWWTASLERSSPRRGPEGRTSGPTGAGALRPGLGLAAPQPVGGGGGQGAALLRERPTPAGGHACLGALRHRPARGRRSRGLG